MRFARVQTVAGMKAQVKELMASPNAVSGDFLVKSGLVTQQTKFIFRSNSAHIVWLIQVHPPRPFACVCVCACVCVHERVCMH